MNREQAINLADDNCYGDWEGNALGVDDVINTIYDDFESRICVNCQHYPSGKCSVIDERYSEHYMGDFMPPPDFGCTEFVRSE